MPNVKGNRFNMGSTLLSALLHGGDTVVLNAVPANAGAQSLLLGERELKLGWILWRIIGSKGVVVTRLNPDFPPSPRSILSEICSKLQCDCSGILGLYRLDIRGIVNRIRVGRDARQFFPLEGARFFIFTTQYLCPEMHLLADGDERLQLLCHLRCWQDGQVSRSSEQDLETVRRLLVLPGGRCTTEWIHHATTLVRRLQPARPFLLRSLARVLNQPRGSSAECSHWNCNDYPSHHRQGLIGELGGDRVVIGVGVRSGRVARTQRLIQDVCVFHTLCPVEASVAEVREWLEDTLKISIVRLYPDSTGDTPFLEEEMVGALIERAPLGECSHVDHFMIWIDRGDKGNEYFAAAVEPLTEDQKQRLKPGGLLDDTCISLAFERLRRLYGLQSGTQPYVLVDAELALWFRYEESPEHLRKMASALGIQEADVILLPVSDNNTPLEPYGGSHWSLLVLRISRGLGPEEENPILAEYYDSYAGNDDSIAAALVLAEKVSMLVDLGDRLVMEAPRMEFPLVAQQATIRTVESTWRWLLSGFSLN